MSAGRTAATVLLLAGGAVPAAPAQSLVDRTPNLQGPWTLPAWAPAFVFSHRFEFVQGGDELVNIPTLTLGLGLPGPLAAGLNFTSNSEVGTALGGNETEFWAQLRAREAGPVRLRAVAAYNTAAESADLALTGSITVGAAELVVETRLLSDGLGRGEAIGVAGAGAIVRLTPRLALVGDLLHAGGAVGDAAWSAGLAVAIPGSPHTLGLYATNAGATTLQGTAREKVIGPEAVRYGFAFTIPLGSGSQWARIFSRADDGPAGAQGDTVFVPMRDIAFAQPIVTIRRGQVVVWTNRDPVIHTVTSDDGVWDSGVLREGERFVRRFEQAGRYPYHCIPHPQMRAVVVVRDD